MFRSSLLFCNNEVEQFGYIWIKMSKMGGLCKIRPFYCLFSIKETHFHLTFWPTSWLPYTCVQSLILIFKDTMEFHYRSSLTWGLMSIFGLDCAILSPILTLFIGLTVCILHIFIIECPATHCLFCDLYGFRCACVLL